MDPLMPYKLPSKFVSSVDFSPGVLKNRTECAVLIATVASEWTRIEHELAIMFGFATGISRANGTDMWSTEPNIPAFAALSALESLHARIAAISAALNAISLPDNLKESFDSISLELRRRAGERNSVVHGLWGITERYPKDVILRPAPQSDDLIKYTAKDFGQIIERMAGTSNRISDFWAQVTASRAGVLVDWPEDP